MAGVAGGRRRPCCAPTWAAGKRTSQTSAMGHGRTLASRSLGDRSLIPCSEL